MVEPIGQEPSKQVKQPSEEPPKTKRVSFPMIIKFAIGTFVTKVLQSWGKDIKAQAAKDQKSSEKQARENSQLKTEQLQNKRLQKKSKHTKV